MTSLQDRHAAFVDALTEYENATTEYANALAEEARYEANRHLAKRDAILRMMELDNPTMPGKKYSASQAESFVEIDSEYYVFLAQCRGLTVTRIIAHTKMESARLRGLMLAKGDF